MFCVIVICVLSSLFLAIGNYLIKKKKDVDGFLEHKVVEGAMEEM